MLKIGITCKITEATSYKESRNSLAVDWLDFFNRFTHVPIVIPHGLFDVDTYLDILQLDGIILSGGNNVNPALYGANAELNSVYNFRDDAEIQIIAYCMKRKIPLVGICRGMFMINVFFNGRLSHNIKKHVNVNHEIIINKFGKYFKSIENVNSYHENAIKKHDIGTNLECFAMSKEGYVEGLFNPNEFIFGIQWHPEREPFNESTATFITDIMKKKIKY